MHFLSASGEIFRRRAACIFLSNFLKALLYVVGKEMRNPGLKIQFVRRGIQVGDIKVIACCSRGSISKLLISISVFGNGRSFRCLNLETARRAYTQVYIRKRSYITIL